MTATPDDEGKRESKLDPRDTDRAARLATFRARSTVDLAQETWEKFPKLGVQRFRVLGGWVYRHYVPRTELNSEGPHSDRLTFVPDPPKIVYTASSPPLPYGYGP